VTSFVYSAIATSTFANVLVTTIDGECDFDGPYLGNNIANDVDDCLEQCASLSGCVNVLVTCGVSNGGCGHCDFYGVSEGSPASAVDCFSDPAEYPLAFYLWSSQEPS